MMRHAIVDTTTDIVVNIIEYDTDISNTVPPGMEAPMLAIASETADMGWLYQDGVFVNPNKKPSSSGVSAAGIVQQSYRAGLIRDADKLQAQGKNYDALKLLLKAQA